LDDNPAAQTAPIPRVTDPGLTREADALDILMALSIRQESARLAATAPMPVVRPHDRPAQRGPGAHRKPRSPQSTREKVRRYQHRSPSPVRGGFGQPHTAQVVALIAARNEADAIEGAVLALRAQHHSPDRILVVVNNTTDNTAQLARAAGADVIVMDQNEHKKAGALNYALSLVLPGLDDRDMVLIQDADTKLNPEFLTAAVAAMGPGVGGVCARYDNPPPANLLERLQGSEFARSRRQITRRDGTVKILVGIASVFTAGTLRKVVAAREAGMLPGSHTVYNNTSLCEDYELTLAMKTLGFRLACPEDCRPLTHAMPTVRKLWDQRVRWSRGALDDLRMYGLTKTTRGYAAAQAGRLVAMVSPLVYAAYLLSLETSYGHIAWSRPWLLINVLFAAERVITVRKAGLLAMLLSALLLPELFYDWFMGAAYLTGLTKHLRGTATQWHET
jgi:cellulose synthase/poly-beta-1,6-N-acetylglucosamine synthase-like glycosyltransferase